MEVDESKTEPEKSTPDVTVKEEKDEVKDDKETKDEDKVKKEVSVNSFNYHCKVILQLKIYFVDQRII